MVILILVYIIIRNLFTQVDIVGDKVDTEKIINSLMDENFPSLTLTDQFSYKQSGELYMYQPNCRTAIEFYLSESQPNKCLQLQVFALLCTPIERN